MPRRSHLESTALLNAPAGEAFAWLDDFRKLSAHMERPSAMMAGSRMAIETDAAGGRAVGSRVRMHGAMLGMTLALDEVVTQREPPVRKAWKTTSTDLLVIGDYELGFELQPLGERSRLRVFIHYERPTRGAGRWLGMLFGRLYARWCTQRMVADAVKHFGAG